MDGASRLSRTFLYHIWACAAWGLLWTMRPDLSATPADEIGSLRSLFAAALVYLVLRTWLTFRGRVRAPCDQLWPLIDIALITAALGCKAEPERSWIALLYFIPLAQAAATLDLRWALGAAALATIGFAAVAGSRELFAANPLMALFRIGFFLLLASLLTQLGRAVAESHRDLALAQYGSELSAEMHDGLQQYLVGIYMRLEMLEELIDRDPQTAARLAVEQRFLARQAADELRVMVRRLRSPLLSEDGLDETLRHYLALFSESSGLVAELQVSGESFRLSPRAEHVVLRVVQEALNNIQKHAHASHVTIELHFQADALVCRVIDDGVGFDVDCPPVSAELCGLGLDTMERRAAQVQGQCALRSVPGQGTEVELHIPLTASPPKRWPRSPGTRLPPRDER